jgi:coenzyme PQQ precursor peptide PqqA
MANNRGRQPSIPKENELMEWTKPEFEEIWLNCEINSYANAEL